MRFSDIIEARYSAYHGTKSPVNFDAFSLDFFRSANPSTDHNEVPCIWASEKPNTAILFGGGSPHGFENDTAEGARVIPVHIHLNNPMIVDAENEKDFHRSDKYVNKPDGRLWNLGYIKYYYLIPARDKGHDGVIFKNCYDGWVERGDIYAVFNPKNIEFKLSSIKESFGSDEDLPVVLKALAKQLKGKTYDAAKRIIASKVGSIKPREKFDDDVANAIFLRLQRTAQVGQYDSEEAIKRLGRNAERLTGDDLIKVYRSAPTGTTLRPGDFVAASKHETGFYKHGDNTIKAFNVPRQDVLKVSGSTGGGTEYIYLPINYVKQEPKEYFQSFKEFYDFSNL